MSGENHVQVDPDQLAAEADAIPVPDEAPAVASGADGEGPPADGQGDALTFDQAEALAASYEGAAFVLYDQAADIIAPNWRVTAEEKRQLAHSTAVALALWFPDQQLPPKYVALLTLAGTFYAVTAARRDPDTGELRPMRVPAPGAARARVAPDPAPGREDGEPVMVGGGFRTSA